MITYLLILCFSYTPYFIIIFFQICKSIWPLIVLLWNGFDILILWCCWWFMRWLDISKRIVDFIFIEMCFLFKGFRYCVQTELCRIFGKFFRVRIFWILGCHTGLGTRFSNKFWYQCIPYEFLKGVSGNRSPPKDTRWLPRVWLSGRGVTNLIHLQYVSFLFLFYFYF